MRKFLKYLIFGLLALIGALVLYGSIVYSPTYVYRVLVCQDSDAFDWQKFPNHRLSASPTPYHFASSPDPRVEELFSKLCVADDWNSFMEMNRTQAFFVIQNGAVLYENYYNDTQRDSIVTSFSVAKSFDSALIAKAIEEGYINSVDDPITTYLPELAKRDPKFNEITIRHLLLMASGMEYTEMRPLLFNSDDPLTTYFPDQRKIALVNTFINEPPGQHFQYNKYHPQLLGLILERTTGMTVTNYLQTRLWDPLVSMEFDGSWSTDSRDSDFEKMETGVNARAIDFDEKKLREVGCGAEVKERVPCDEDHREPVPQVEVPHVTFDKFDLHAYCSRTPARCLQHLGRVVDPDGSSSLASERHDQLTGAATKFENGTTVNRCELVVELHVVLRSRKERVVEVRIFVEHVALVCPSD